jgi:hypothetical protein
MNTSHLDGTTTVQQAGQAVTAPPTAGSTGRTPLLLWGLWLATAVGLVVVPFLTQFRVRTRYQDEAIREGIPDVRLEWSSNGWGQWDGLAGHDVRTGILFAAVAALLVLAVLATVGWRQARWPLWLGLLASTMAVTASALQLVELEANHAMREMDDATFRTDMTLGLGAWMVPGLGAMAATAVVMSLIRIRRLRRQEPPRFGPQRPTPESLRPDRLALLLSGLWVAAAIGLVVGPFLTVYEVSAADGGEFVVQIDGWGRTEGALGVPCAILAVGLAASVIALAVRRTAILPLRIGLLAGAATVVVSAFLLLRLEQIHEVAGPSMRATTGIGGWLVLAAGVLAAVAVVLTLIRQHQLKVD